MMIKETNVLLMRVQTHTVKEEQRQARAAPPAAWTRRGRTLAYSCHRVLSPRGDDPCSAC